MTTAEDGSRLRDLIEALDWVIADRERSLQQVQREQQRLMRRWNGVRRTMWDDWDASRYRELQASAQDLGHKLKHEREQRADYARVLSALANTRERVDSAERAGQSTVELARDEHPPYFDQSLNGHG